jgi:non-ribosomal peptide synthetase component E (peptide arylation enzyme)
LANYKVPKHFTVCAALPMLPVGKVDRSALRKATIAQHLG